MKKLVLILLTVLLLVLFSNDAKAQCDVGFTPVTRTLMINGCTFEVDLCVKCPYGPVPGEMRVSGWRILQTTPQCSTGLHAGQISNAIMSQVGTYAFIESICTFPPNNLLPCPQLSESFTIHYPLCMQMELIHYFGDTYLYYSSCPNTAICSVDYSFCVDNGQTPPVVVRTVERAILNYGPISCTKEGWQVQVPIEYDQPTDCYIIHSECNP